MRYHDLSTATGRKCRGRFGDRRQPGITSVQPIEWSDGLVAAATMCLERSPLGDSMHVTRFFTTPEGGSAFDEFDMPLDNDRTDRWGNALRFSEPFGSPAVRVYEAPTGTFQDWHNAPTRQLCVMLNGVWEIGTTDGEKRRWGPGEVFMPDTVEGKGHTSEVLEGPVRMVFIPVPPEVDIELWGAAGP